MGTESAKPRIEPFSTDAAFAEWARVGLFDEPWCGTEVLMLFFPLEVKLMLLCRNLHDRRCLIAFK